MRQRALQVAPDTRQVAQILWFAITALEAGEDAEDLGSTLRRQRGIGAGKAQIGRASCRERV